MRKKCFGDIHVCKYVKNNNPHPRPGKRYLQNSANCIIENWDNMLKIETQFHHIQATYTWTITQLILASVYSSVKWE